MYHSNKKKIIMIITWDRAHMNACAVCHYVHGIYYHYSYFNAMPEGASEVSCMLCTTLLHSIAEAARHALTPQYTDPRHAYKPLQKQQLETAYNNHITSHHSSNRKIKQRKYPYHVFSYALILL